MVRYWLILAVWGCIAGCGSSGGADAGRDAPAQDGGSSDDVAVDAGDANDLGGAADVGDAPDAPLDGPGDAPDAPLDGAGDAPDAPLDGPGDAPDAPADAPSTEAAPQCGNEPVGPVEHCVVPGVGCQDCRLTDFVLCLRADGTEWPCVGLQGADLIACETLVECAFRIYPQRTFLEECGSVTSDECLRFGFSDRPYCYCSDPTCSKGGDLECSAAFEAVARSNDSAEVRRQIADPTARLRRVVSFLEFTACNQHCRARILLPVAGQLGSHHGGLSFIVNEINHVQEGSDPGEFIEIFNGTGGPVDFAGKDLVGFADGKRVLTVPLDGVIANGGYLVVGAPAVSVPAGVKKVDLPPGANVIPDTSAFFVMFLPTGAPDPSPLPDDIAQFDQAFPDAPLGGSQEGSACLIPNGVDRFGFAAAVNHCAKATPGSVNFR